MDALNTAVSGLNAAALRLKTSAGNVANQNTPNFKAQKVEQQALDVGGVRTDVVDKDPATVTSVDLDGNAVELPNTSPEQEIVEQIVASYTYKANLKTIQVVQDLQESLLDIQA